MPRPNFRPTEEQRRMVKSLSAFGVPQEQMANRMGIRSPKTLRKHFRDELDGGALEANSKVAKTLFDMATSGQVPAATMFWLKCRAGWKERPMFEPAAIPPPPFVVAQENGVQQP
jgi:hypothetical protein